MQNETLLEKGSIPARAGEPGAVTQQTLSEWVYPRSRGGTNISGIGTLSGHGLSPLARGNLYVGQSAGMNFGSIPARAGEPLAITVADRPLRVYPRSRGGTDFGQAYVNNY